MVDPCPPVVVPLVPLEPLDGGVQSGGGVHVPFSGFEPFSPFGPFSPFWQEIAPISKKVNTSILIVQEYKNGGKIVALLGFMEKLRSRVILAFFGQRPLDCMRFGDIMRPSALTLLFHSPLDNYYFSIHLCGNRVIIFVIII